MSDTNKEKRIEQLAKEKYQYLRGLMDWTATWDDLGDEWKTSYRTEARREIEAKG
jgi:hypothetical protein